ncbi:MAG: HAMP domain-containing protein [Calditrichaceae bacterium]|nr:HAMP domain-containing protein [Calditrichaceae bacterium]
MKKMINSNKSSWKFTKPNSIFSGLNFQFVFYFLMFSYVPLLFFSILGYVLHREIIRNAHQQYLDQIGELSARNIKTYQVYQKADMQKLYRFYTSVSKDTQSLKTVFNDFLSKFHSISLIHKNNPVFSFGKSAIADLSIGLNHKNIISRKYLAISYKSDEENGVIGLVDSCGIKEILPAISNIDIIRLREKNDIFNLCIPSFSGNAKASHRGYLTSEVAIGPSLNIVIQRSENQLYNELRNFLYKIIIADLFIGLFILLLAMVLSKKITNPIRILLDAAQKIGKGDLSQPVKVNSKNEIKILADEFEIMRQKLNKSYTGLELIIDERTEALREAQFQISHQEKMASLGLLAAGVAHEIGNPLTSISSMAQLIKRKIKDQQFIEYLNTILKNIERISKIVRELVDFARPSNYESSFVDMNDIIRNAVSIVKYDKRAKYIFIKMDLDPDIPPIFLVSDQLLQVFLNILINAVDALKNEDDNIIIRSFKTEENFIVEIEDTGTGIPKENLSKIFEPFFTTKKIGKGTGLGLSVSYGIIKNLDGSIDVKSEPGMGSVFKISLPVKLAEKSNEG